MSTIIFAGSQVFSQGLSIHLSSPSYGGHFNILCFGGKTGSIDLSVTGGIPPYRYQWTTGDSVQGLQDLPVGYYGVTVTDSLNNRVQGNITLTGPDALYIYGNVYKHPNNFNVSCYNCYNGSISMTVSGGIDPYSYHWKDGPQTLNRTQLGAGSYELIVEDNNGCVASSGIFNLGAPDRSDWTMNGNAGTNPSINYMGTSDQQDFVFKTNSSELLRLNSDGTVKLSALGVNNPGLLFIDNNGIIGSGNELFGPNYPLANVPWVSKGNGFAANSSPAPILGTLGNYAMDIRTNNQTRMYIDPTGKVGIGTNSPFSTLDVVTQDVNGGIIINQIGSNKIRSEIKFNSDWNVQWSIGSNYADISQLPSFYIYNNVHSPTGEVDFYIDGLTGKVGIGCVPPVLSQSQYRLYVDAGGIETREVKVTLDAFSDYVFKTGYKLPSLKELESFIVKNKHLPDIPSEAEVIKAGGFELGDMQIKLVKKIEEMTLYILQ